MRWRLNSPWSVVVTLICVTVAVQLCSIITTGPTSQARSMVQDEARSVSPSPEPEENMSEHEQENRTEVALRNDSAMTTKMKTNTTMNARIAYSIIITDCSKPFLLLDMVTILAYSIHLVSDPSRSRYSRLRSHRVRAEECHEVQPVPHECGL